MQKSKQDPYAVNETMKMLGHNSAVIEGKKARERRCVMEYKKKIMELLNKIDTNTATPDGIASGNTFLKRIYVSILEYVGEAEGAAV